MIIIKRQYFNSLASEWDEMTDVDEKFISRVFDLFPDFEKPNILDVGSGTGVLIPFVFDIYGEKAFITEVDYSEDMIALAKDKFESDNIEFKAQDILNITFEKTFDLILCYSVFPHFSDKEEVINKLSNILNSEGKLVIFHSSSRKELNEFHSSKEDAPISDDILPPAEEVSDMARKANLSTEYIKDDEEGYVIILAPEIN